MKNFLISIFNLTQRSKIVVQFEVFASLESHALNNYYYNYYYMCLINNKRVSRFESIGNVSPEVITLNPGDWISELRSPLNYHQVHLTTNSGGLLYTYLLEERIHSILISMEARFVVRHVSS